jgi:hypothetical protein
MAVPCCMLLLASQVHTNRSQELSKTVKTTDFCNVMMYSLADHYELYRGTYCLHLQGRRVSRAGKKYDTLKRGQGLGHSSTPSSTLKMEATGSFKTLVPIYHTMWCHIPVILTATTAETTGLT